MSALLALLSVFAAVVPMTAFLFILWRLDRYEREPLGLLLLVMAWGAVGGVIGALVPGLALNAGASRLLEAPVAAAVGAVLIAPLTEEPAKALGVLLVASTRQFDNTVDGFVYGAAAGLGFAMTENLLYFLGPALNGDPSGWATLVFIRTLWSGLMHAGASSMVGAALGFAKYRGALVKLTVPALGLGAAIAMHALWNGLLTANDLTGGSGLLVGLNLLLFPMEFFVLFVVMQLALLDERATIRRELAEEARLGLIPEEHVPILASVLRRSGRRWLPPTVDHHAYVHAASTLALRRHQARRRPAMQAEVEVLRAEVRHLLAGARA